MNDPELSDDQLEAFLQEVQGSEDLAGPDARRAKEALQLIQAIGSYPNSESVQIFDTAGESVSDTRSDESKFGNSLQLDNQSFGRFQVERLIGQGGFGLVYLARDADLDRDVALKIPRLVSAADPQSTKRFLREGKAAGALSHPNIVPVYQVGQVGEVCYIASQYIAGQTLADYQETLSGDEQAPSAITPRTAADIVRRLSEAMQHAHQRGVLHRDLKPANILVENSSELMQDGQSEVKVADRVRIADFGLAKTDKDQFETQSGALVGTPAFMSPEQVSGQNKVVGPAADIYSLGAILYQLLAGRPPHVHDTLIATANAIVNDAPASLNACNPEVDSDIAAITEKCLEKRPSDRYASMHELATDLGRYLRNESIEARRPSRTERLSRWAKRNPSIAGSLVAAGLFGIVAVAGLSFGLLRTQQALQLESEALLKETTAKQESEQRYQAVKQSVDDYFVTVSQNETLRQTPGGEELSRELLTHAVSYYERYVVEHASDRSRMLKVADVKGKLGVIRLKNGNESQALAEFDKALELIDQHCLENQSAKDGIEVIANRSETLFHKAMALVNSNSAEALATTEKAIALQLVLCEKSDEYRNHLRLAEQESLRGQILTRLGTFEEALKSKEKALSYREALVANGEMDDSALRNVATARGEVAIVLKKLRRIEDAIAIEAQLIEELSKHLAQKPQDWKSLEVLVASSCNHAVSYYQLSQPEPMLRTLGAADPHAERLSAIFPLNAKFQDLRRSIYELSSAAYMLLRDTEKSIHFGDRAIRFLENQLQLTPASERLKIGLLQSQLNLASTKLNSTGKIELAELSKAKALAEELLSGNQDDLRVQQFFALALANLANFCNLNGDPEQAIATAQEGLDFFGVLAKDAISPNMHDEVYALLRYKAQGEYSLGRFSDSVQTWEQALAIIPKSAQNALPSTRILLACAQVRSGDLPSANDSISGLDLDAAAKSGNKLAVARWYCVIAGTQGNTNRESLLDQAIDLLATLGKDKLSKEAELMDMNGDWELLRGSRFEETIAAED